MTSSAMTIVIEPSMIKSHSSSKSDVLRTTEFGEQLTQAGLPNLPSILAMMPAAMSPPNALASMFAPYKKAILGGSSVLLYQQLIKKNTPGKNGATSDEHLLKF